MVDVKRVTLQEIRNYIQPILQWYPPPDVSVAHGLMSVTSLDLWQVAQAVNKMAAYLEAREENSKEKPVLCMQLGCTNVARWTSVDGWCLCNMHLPRPNTAYIPFQTEERLEHPVVDVGTTRTNFPVG